MNNLFRKKQEVSKLLLSIIVVFVVVLNACSMEAKSLKKGEVYRSLGRSEVIEVISKNELETNIGGQIILARYDFKGGKLCVVIGDKVIYFEITKEGLKQGNTIYYSKAALAALEEKKRKAEEEKRARKFKDNGNGTVTHNDTKLMWQQGEGGGKLESAIP